MNLRFKSLKQYLKFEDSKWITILSDLGLFYPSLNSPIGYKVELTSVKALNEELISKSHRENLILLCNEVKFHLNKPVRLKTGLESKPRVYNLIGLELTHEEYYYILEDPVTGQKRYETCLTELEYLVL